MHNINVRFVVLYSLVFFLFIDVRECGDENDKARRIIR